MAIAFRYSENLLSVCLSEDNLAPLFGAFNSNYGQIGTFIGLALLGLEDQL